MDWNAIEGNWKQFSGKVQAEWSALGADHVAEIAGQRDRLSEKLQQFYGISRDSADAQIDAFAERLEDKAAG